MGSHVGCLSSRVFDFELALIQDALHCKVIAVMQQLNERLIRIQDALHCKVVLISYQNEPAVVLKV